MSKTIQKNRNNSNYSHQFPVKSYLDAKEFRENRLWRIKNDLLVTEYNGEELTLRQFMEIFPVAWPTYFCKDNPDKSRLYLH